MFHTQAFWLRTLRLHPLKPFGSRDGVGQVPLPPLPLGGCRLRSTAPARSSSEALWHWVAWPDAMVTSDALAHDAILPNRRLADHH